MYRIDTGLSRRAKFERTDNHRFLDIIQYAKDGKEPAVKHGMLKHNEINPWLDREAPYNDGLDELESVKASLRVLVLIPQQQAKATVVTIPVSRDVFAKLEQAFGIDPAILDYLGYEGINISGFKAFKDGFGLCAIMKREHIVVTHDPVSSTTYVLTRGPCGHEANTLVEELEKSSTNTQSIQSVVFSWIAEMSQFRARRVLGKKRMLLTIESEIDLFGSFTTDHLNRADLLQLTQDLMCLKNTADESALTFLQEAINTVPDLAKHFAPESLISQTPPSLDLRLQISQLLTGLQALRREIEQRADILLQTTYNLIAQRDNDVNVKIAEATQRDSVVQKEIAEFMKNIAVQTYYDSATMKAMAFITLCCLPGTLAATFFGAGFFNFDHKASSSIVSPWIWLYCVITTALTGLLYIIWVVLRRRLLRDPCPGYPKFVSSIGEQALAHKPEATKSTTLPQSTTSRSKVSPSDAEEPIQPSVDVNAEDLHQANATYETTYERTWFSSRIGWPLEDDQCSICFEIPSDKSE